MANNMFNLKIGQKLVAFFLFFLKVSILNVGAKQTN